VAEQHGTDNLVVLLGTPTTDSSQLYAQTVTEGDPTWAGPLAGIALQLPVYHVLDEEVRRQFAANVADEQLAMAELVLEGEALSEAVKSVRATTPGGEGR